MSDLLAAGPQLLGCWRPPVVLLMSFLIRPVSLAVWPTLSSLNFLKAHEKKKINKSTLFLKLFIYYDCTGSSLLHAGSPLVEAIGATLYLAVHGFLIVEASLVAEGSL